jgi:hypothetical protein
MVQALNTKALVTLASIVRRPGLMVPHVTVHTVSDLDYAAMKHHSGIRAVVFDKDNTLTAPYENVLHPAVVPGFKFLTVVSADDPSVRMAAAPSFTRLVSSGVDQPKFVVVAIFSPYATTVA